MPEPVGDISVDVALDPGELTTAMRAEVAAGLTATPKELAPKWFYDEEGSVLFDAITRLPEYYPTRAERSILVARAGAIAQASGADTLIELGSGTSEKTRLLLDALRDAGTLRRFVPFDVDETTLRKAAATVSTEYPGVDVHAVVGDFERHLSRLPGGARRSRAAAGVGAPGRTAMSRQAKSHEGSRRLVAFLGSTIGNLAPEARSRFLGEVGSLLSEGDSFLLGTDLVKDVSRLEAAYDDSAGITAAFNRNLLVRINRELDADFDVDAFTHVAVYDEVADWIEMRLRSERDQVVTVAGLGLQVSFAAGEEMRTEISAKFRPAGIEAELVAAGLRPLCFWTDEPGDFALTLAVPK